MRMRSMKDVTRRSWNIIPKTDTVIDWVNLLGKNQQDLLVFSDRKGRLIWYGDVDTTGVDGGGDENKAPLKIENENNLDYQEDQEEIHPEQEDQPIQQTVKV